MFLSISRSLRKASRFRIGVGLHLHGLTAVLVFFFIGIFYLMYWSALACLWMMFGVLWLCWLPFHLLIKLTRRKKAEARHENLS